MPPESSDRSSNDKSSDKFPDVEPPSVPASPKAIDRLVVSVEALRTDIREALARLEANYSLILHEIGALQRARADHEERLTVLEGSSPPPRLPSLKVAAKSVKKRKRN